MVPTKFDECAWLAIPAVAELAGQNQWVVWGGKGKINQKAPRRVDGAGLASPTDPRTWSPFADAYRAVVEGRASGVGYVFSSEQEIVGIDLDDCFNEDGKTLRPTAIEIYARALSYTELSPSGKGVHIYGKWSGTTRPSRKGSIDGGDGRAQKVEFYFAERYFRFTSDILEQSTEALENIDDAICWITDRLPARTERGEGTADGDPLRLDPNAEPPARKFSALLLASRKFAKAWNRDRPDLGTDASAYDMSLASFAAAANWTDQEIANLIISHRREHESEAGRAKSLRIGYIQSTIQTARDGERLDLSETITSAALNAQEIRETSEPTALEQISMALGVVVQRVVQRGIDPAAYYLEIEHKLRIGEQTELAQTNHSIRLGGGDSLQSQARMRSAISAVVGEMPPRLKSKDFDRVVSLLVRTSVLEDISEGNRLQETEHWIEQATENIMRCMTEVDIGDYTVTDRAAYLYRDHLYIRSERLRALLAACGIRVVDLPLRLKEAGFSVVRQNFVYRGTGSRSIFRAWGRFHHEQMSATTESGENAG
jgi:hypothetical protein